MSSPAERIWPPIEWAFLTQEQRDKRVRAEFCERCGATETQPCVTRNYTMLKNYTHYDRHQAALKRFIEEQKLSEAPGRPRS